VGFIISASFPSKSQSAEVLAGGAKRKCMRALVRQASIGCVPQDRLVAKWEWLATSPQTLQHLKAIDNLLQCESGREVLLGPPDNDLWLKYHLQR
jgi:hypothetical protein